MNKALVKLFAAGSLLGLAGCLSSDEPMFDASNATATPLAAGRYEVCTGTTDDNKKECNPVDVTVSDDGRYEFDLGEEGVAFARFAGLAGGDYAAQIGDDDSYQYYWGRKESATFRLVMIWCEDLPAELVDDLLSRGAMTANDRRTACEPANAETVLIAAAAIRDNGPGVKQNWITMTPIGGDELN
ncbi:MAG: hypothetical protein R3C60_13305 [Parvularculaceae bacterium]